MEKRNEYMVNSSSFVIAVCSGKPSGTYKTIILAKFLGKYIIVIDPFTLEVTTINS